MTQARDNDTDESIAEFDDPRLVAIYETVNPYEPDAQPGYYLRVARELGARSVLDLGCGTGLITRMLAREGFNCVGIDPAPLMIAAARDAEYGEGVQWVVGDASAAHPADADLAIMTGHVAQFFVSDTSWTSALVALHAALRPDGHLAFESRNPDAREWEGWTRAERTVVHDLVVGAIETWTEAEDIHDGIVECTNHYVFGATGEELISRCSLRFRSRDELTASLGGAGFAIARVQGDWDGRPADASTPELIVMARRAVP
jgi:SAM-dependent methyltransferase